MCKIIVDPGVSIAIVLQQLGKRPSTRDTQSLRKIFSSGAKVIVSQNASCV